MSSQMVMQWALVCTLAPPPTRGADQYSIPRWRRCQIAHALVTNATELFNCVNDVAWSAGVLLRFVGH